MGDYLFYIRWKHIYINIKTIFFLINLASVDLSICTIINHIEWRTFKHGLRYGLAMDIKGFQIMCTIPQDKVTIYHTTNMGDMSRLPSLI